MSSDNINPNEVEKFNQMAKDWWDPNGPMKPLHHLNPVRLGYIEQFSTLSQANIIDVGCGAGLLSEAMAQAGGKVLGIDASPEAIQIAKEHAELTGATLTYEKTIVETVAARAAGQYDVVTCLEMIEHVPDPGAVINACATLIKPGGKVFFSTLNRNIKSYLLGIIAAEYILGLLPKGTHDYKSFIRPSELDETARKTGLHLLDLSGITYNPLTQNCKLSKDVSINYICCYEKRGA